MKIVVFDECDSTNLVARRLLEKAPLSTPLAVLSYHQTRGHGANGKYWQDQKGSSLLTSLVFPERSHISSLPALFFLSLRKVLPKYNILFKWPNDFLYRGGKVGGMMMIQLRLRNKNYYILGAGLNLSWHPRVKKSIRTSSLDERTNPLSLLKKILSTMGKRRLSPVLWEKVNFHLAYKGEKVMVSLPKGVRHKGTLISLTERGCMLKSNGSYKLCTAGHMRKVEN